MTDHKPLMSDSDIKKFQKWISSKKGRKAMDKASEQLSGLHEAMEEIKQDRANANAKWWAENRDNVY